MKPLVIFELANNHMGSVNHAKLIIKNYYELTKKFRNKIDFAIKFQYRDSNSFIHKSFIESDDKHVKRFKSTFLTRSQWSEILKFSRPKFKLICTPFDEISVANVIKDRFDYLKIASCSATDWPLIEHIAKKAKQKKIICSLGGLNKDEISSVISFFSTRKIKVQFLYCVAKYPTLSSDLNLIYFDEMKQFYGEKVAGISLHEEPDEYLSGSIGYAMGARIFEKHIGVSKGSISLNKYSVNAKQMNTWLSFLEKTIVQVGSVKSRNENLKVEKDQLKNFQRGVYNSDKKKLQKGSKLDNRLISFNFPAIKGQLTANNFSKFSEMVVTKELNIDEKILKKNLSISNPREIISRIRDEVRNLSFLANIVVPDMSRIEVSHHYGIKKFYKFGLCMITVINQSYCKKYLFMFKNQQHPAQYHKIKQETFLILYGKIILKTKYKGKKTNKTMKAGEIFTIVSGMIHEFKAISKDGAVIEEISSKHIKTDSYYIDKKISKNKNRKSLISFY
jgi:sialic acid synthase SpsE/D-lyxose ketol-isomerase